MPTSSYLSGIDLLRGFDHSTREKRLEAACRALMQELESIHVEVNAQSLKDNLNNPEVFCSCADAYRMGAEALRDTV